MRKFKEFKKTIKFPVFLDYRIVIIVSNDKKKSREKIMNQFKLIDDVNDDFAALHIWIDSNRTSYLIFSADADVGDIAHEAWHCVRRFMCLWAGASFDNEIVAYHMGFITQEIYDFIKKIDKSAAN